MEKFSNFVSANDLIDVPLINSNFTWFGSENKGSKLDRALINLDWAGSGSWDCSILRRKNLDHNRIVLSSSKCNWGPRPFKFFNIWLEDKHLIESLGSIWSRSKKVNMCARIKELRDFTRDWNKHQFGDININIELMEEKQEEADLNRADYAEKLAIRSELDQLYKAKSSMLCQKSRLNWKLKGERNTKFFHKAFGRRIASNKISRVLVDGIYVTDPENIK